MRYQRAATIVILLAGISGVGWIAWGIYVRNTAGEALKRAAVHLRKSESAAARQALQWLLWFEPQHAEALHLTGLSYLSEENYPSAIAALQRVDAGSRVHADAQLALASALLTDRQWQRAEAELAAHLRRYPRSIKAVRLLSGLLLGELRQREAVLLLEDFLRRAEMDGLSAEDELTLLRDLAAAEFHAPAADACEPALREASERHPQQPAVLLALGQCAALAGRTAEAQTLLNEALQQMPDNWQARMTIGRFHADQGQVDAAEAVFKESQPGVAASASEPVGLEADDRVWELLCRIAELRGDFPRALNAIDRAVSLRAGDKEYQARRARLLQRLGRTQEAQRAYERSHELARADLDLWNLSRDIGGRIPTAAECDRMAKNYDILDRRLQAAAWQRLSVTLRQAPPAAAAP
jgi:tetratricopeptide (TPR) repeat protein